jgi:hypothetical protein
MPSRLSCLQFESARVRYASHIGIGAGGAIRIFRPHGAGGSQAPEARAAMGTERFNDLPRFWQLTRMRPHRRWSFRLVSPPAPPERENIAPVIGRVPRAGSSRGTLLSWPVFGFSRSFDEGGPSKAARRWFRTTEYPLGNEYRCAGRRPWIIESDTAGEFLPRVGLPEFGSAGARGEGESGALDTRGRIRQQYRKCGRTHLALSLTDHPDL